MKTDRRTWRRFLPNIEFQLHLPFFHMGTQLFYEGFEARTIEVIHLRIEIIKWSYRFRLYWKEV